MKHDSNETVGRLIRLPDVLKRIPVSKSAWWLGVKTGRFPVPVKLGVRTTCWRLEDILALANSGVASSNTA